MKKLISIIAIALLSFSAGALFMCYMSLKASETFLDIVRVNYISEQEILASHEKKTQDTHQVVTRYKNIVEAKESPGLFCFSVKNNAWDFFFPFETIGLKEVKKEVGSRAFEYDLGISHGKLAYAYERGGFPEAAQKEYEKAGVLLHYSPERVKKVIEGLY